GMRGSEMAEARWAGAYLASACFKGPRQGSNLTAWRTFVKPRGELSCLGAEENTAGEGLSGPRRRPPPTRTRTQSRPLGRNSPGGAGPRGGGAPVAQEQPPQGRATPGGRNRPMLVTPYDCQWAYGSGRYTGG